MKDGDDEGVSEEKLPISEKLKVLDSVTLYKTRKWWSAIALVDSFGRKQIAMYVWLNREGKWKRNQKFIIHNKAGFHVELVNQLPDLFGPNGFWLLTAFIPY